MRNTRSHGTAVAVGGTNAFIAWAASVIGDSRSHQAGGKAHGHEGKAVTDGNEENACPPHLIHGNTRQGGCQMRNPGNIPSSRMGDGADAPLPGNAGSAMVVDGRALLPCRAFRCRLDACGRDTLRDRGTAAVLVHWALGRHDRRRRGDRDRRREDRSRRRPMGLHRRHLVEPFRRGTIQC
jgi:hypothetical protein